jgi:hypothetical protein
VARKVANIAGNPRVAVVVGWEDAVSVQVGGSRRSAVGADREEYGRIYLDARPDSFRVIEGPLA